MDFDETNKPKISIIVPIYNVEQYLAKCLDSVVNQTLTDVEIICVNDGSTDSSPTILSEYAKTDERIKIINQKNQGLGAARNSGLKIATGEYVGFVDSDDWLDLDFYEKLYNRAKNKNADIVRSSYMYHYSNYEKPMELNDLFLAKEIDDSPLDTNEHSVVVWNALYNMNFLKNNNIMYFDNINCAEDLSFTARTSFQAKNIYSVGNTMYHYRKDRVGQLCELTFEKIFAQLKANIIVTDFLNKNLNNVSEQEYIVAYKRCVMRLDNIFKESCSEVHAFTKSKRLEYLKKFSSIINGFKLDKSILIDIDENLKYLINCNYKAFIKVYQPSKHSFWSKFCSRTKDIQKAKVYVEILGMKFNYTSKKLLKRKLANLQETQNKIDIFRQFLDYQKIEPAIPLSILNSSNNSNSVIYNEAFYRNQAADSYKSAKIVVGILQKYYKPESVLDVGCGVGTWLRAWQDGGVKVLQGIDANEMPEKQLYMPKKNILTFDFEKNSIENINLPKFDLSMTLECLEHITESKSNSVVDLLTKSSDIVLFSSAIPMQTGTNHINCHRLQYWVELFKQKGFKCYDIIRSECIRQNLPVEPWYMQNILVFAKDEKAVQIERNGAIPVENPIMFYHNYILKNILNNIAK